GCASEGLAAFAIVHCLGWRRTCNAGDAAIAQKLDIPAKRDGADLPPRAPTIVKPDQLRTEADGKCRHPDAAPTRNQKMAEFVEEHDDRQNEDERHHIAGKPASPHAQAADKIHGGHPRHASPALALVTIGLTHDSGPPARPK